MKLCLANWKQSMNTACYGPWNRFRCRSINGFV